MEGDSVTSLCPKTAQMSGKRTYSHLPEFNLSSAKIPNLFIMRKCNLQ